MNELSPEQKKEYQTVILAALLHDIGKFLHRGGGEYKGLHEKASAKFIQNYCDRLRSDRQLYDIDLVELLVKHHHSTKLNVQNELNASNKSNEEKEKIWKLLKIVCDSDNYSCVERDREQKKRKGSGSKSASLDSIFFNISLDRTLPKGNGFRYHLGPLDPLANFPFATRILSRKNKKDREEIKKLVERFEEVIKEFEKVIPSFSHIDDFDYVLSGWLNLLEQYAWAIPSDTRYQSTDISLYDHLKSSAAIAACLYKRHIDAIEKGQNCIRQNEFILIGGDFSGIQDYIFDITNKGSGGASKRLRARSLFVSLFSEVSIHKILHTLELPLVCNLFSAGGKFLLLAPNIEEVNKKLQDVKNEIEEEIHNRFFSQFSFLMSWKEVKDFEEEFKVYDFFKISNDMFYRLESTKVKKFQSVLVKTGSWDESAFKATEIYNQYGNTGDCKVCGKGPGNCKDKGQDTDEIIACCQTCLQDKHFIGRKLPKSNYIAFGKSNHLDLGKGDREKIIIFNHQAGNNEPSSFKKERDTYYVELLENYKDSDEYYLMYDIRGNANRNNVDEKALNSKILPVRKYIANHVPLGDADRTSNETKTKNQLPLETANQVSLKKDKEEQKTVLSFEEIATRSRWHKDEKEYGSDLLGILKADIDNLGLIFSKGFENPERAKEKPNEGDEPNGIDKKTVSRFLTVSRMIELFFSGWIKEIMEEGRKGDAVNELTGILDINRERFEQYLKGKQIDFTNIYTVYSGGDDLVLVGPWETMIIFSILLNKRFREFTCNNDFITLSAGLTFVKAKHPIASGIQQAEVLLDKSKSQGKNRITLFGTTIEWDKFPELIEFFLFLDNKLNNKNSNIKSAFLYRLLEYHRMALNWMDGNDIQGLRYLSALSYDIGRNIVERDKEGNIKKGHEEQRVLQEQMVLNTLINNSPRENYLMKNIKIPLCWALYRNRKVRRDEGSCNS